MNSLQQKNVFVIIPAHNEGPSLAQLINQAKKYTKNIIVVDDGSTDDTFFIAQKNDIIVLRHKINLGKGAALKTGCEAALRLGAKIILFMDADGQHSPDDIPRLIKELEDKSLDIVFGVRKFDEKMPWLMLLGNKFLTMVTNILTGISLQDTQSGFRAFQTNIYPKIRWQSQDYSVETEIIIRAGKHHLKYSQVPIQTIYKDTYKGTTIFDGIKIFFNLLKFKFL